MDWIIKDVFFQPMEVYVDDEAKLTLHGLQQHYVELKDNEKNRKLFDLLDALEFNQVSFSLSTFCWLVLFISSFLQVVIFVKSVQRCIALSNLLKEQNFPAVDIHRAMNQSERLSRYQLFKVFLNFFTSSFSSSKWWNFFAVHILKSSVIAPNYLLRTFDKPIQLKATISC